MATLYGGKPVPEACRELGIGEARFHEMRKEFLASALVLLEKKTAGRKSAEPPEGAAERLTELEDENLTLRAMLEASRIRTEIALTMPNLLKRRTKAGEGIGEPKAFSPQKKRLPQHTPWRSAGSVGISAL
jgi:hypothetical protein